MKYNLIFFQPPKEMINLQLGFSRFFQVGTAFEYPFGVSLPTHLSRLLQSPHGFVLTELGTNRLTKTRDFSKISTQ